MSHPQYVQTVEQWEEQMFRDELEARRIEDANEILAAMSAERDAEFRAALEVKYPSLKGW